MQPDPAREVEDAILAVTPTDVDGLVPVGMHLADGYPITEWGNPRPVAARQAAAARPVVYREVADWILAEHGHGDPVVKALAIAIQLRATDLADQIDTTSTEEAP